MKFILLYIRNLFIFALVLGGLYFLGGLINPGLVSRILLLLLGGRQGIGLWPFALLLVLIFAFPRRRD